MGTRLSGHDIMAHCILVFLHSWVILGFTSPSVSRWRRQMWNSKMLQVPRRGSKFNSSYQFLPIFTPFSYYEPRVSG
ncbi:hypothetical protein F5Y11DRAFT_309695 [Daldinia sp. FL1419]|nr:hypothetical protein F5Y11DRAFT_309695 [Daldinia sp. FL1419]